jgi:hypothetical protein
MIHCRYCSFKFPVLAARFPYVFGTDASAMFGWNAIYSLEVHGGAVLDNAVSGRTCSLRSRVRAGF